MVTSVPLLTISLISILFTSIHIYGLWFSISLPKFSFWLPFKFFELSIKLGSALLSDFLTSVFRAVVFNFPKEENSPCLSLGPARGHPGSFFGRVLPHLSLVALHSLAKCQPLPHFFHIPEGIGSLLWLLLFFLQLFLRLLCLPQLKLEILYHLSVSSGNYSYYCYIRQLRSKISVCLIYSYIDAHPALSGLITSLHSAFEFSKAKDSITAFLAAESDKLFSTAEVSLCKIQVSFGLFTTWGNGSSPFPDSVNLCQACKADNWHSARLISSYIQPAPLPQETDLHQAADLWKSLYPDSILSYYLPCLFSPPWEPL